MSKEITKDVIKRELLRRYNKNTGATLDRGLKEYNDESNKFTLFILTGTPAKGYGIYIPDKKILNLYDFDGKGFKVFRDVIVK